MREAGHDPDSLAGNMLRLGTVASVDRAKARCTVRLAEDAVTGPLPWLTLAGAGLRAWLPPSVGEQVAVLCPDGELPGGFVLPGIASTANPAPASDEAYSLHFGDGAVFRYDPQAHQLSIALPAGGKVSITADVAITGDLDVDGTITATGDVKAGSVTLKTHKHGGVDRGSGQTDGPV